MIVDQFNLSRLTSTATPSSHLNIACRSTWWTTWRLAGTWRSFLLHMAAPTWVQQSSRAVFTLCKMTIQIAGLSSYCVSFFSLHFGRLILHAAFPGAWSPISLSSNACKYQPQSLRPFITLLLMLGCVSFIVMCIWRSPLHTCPTSPSSFSTTHTVKMHLMSFRTSF